MAAKTLWRDILSYAVPDRVKSEVQRHGSVDGSSQGENDSDMIRFVMKICIATLCISLASCGLVLEDPRPYPPPTADSAVFEADAGMGSMQQSLTIQFRTQFSNSQAQPVQTRVDNFPWDMFCPSDLIGESDMCWFLGFVIDF